MKEISPSYFLKQIAISKISPFLVSVQAFVFGVKFFNEIFFSVFPIEFWLIVDGFNYWDFHVVEGVAWEIEVMSRSFVQVVISDVAEMLRESLL